MAETTDTTVLARLVETKSYYRGDFIIVGTHGNGLLISNIPFAAADTSDRGNLPKEGTFFNIINYPRDGGNDLAFVNRAAVKLRFKAFEIAGENDEVNEVSSPPPKPLMQMLKEAADTIVSIGKRAPSSCQKAPVTLKEAISRVRSVKGRSHKRLAKTGETKINRSGTKVFDGLYTEVNDHGDFSIAAGAKGMIVDKEGNIHTSGKIHMSKSDFTRNHSIMGMPTMQNPMVDVSPRMILNPQLDRLPDFSILNWAIKLFSAFDTVKKLFSVKFDMKQDKWWENEVKLGVNKDFERSFKEDQKERGLRGKIK